jgi:hypothetical protein
MKEMFQMEVVLFCTLCRVISCLLVVRGLKFNMDLGGNESQCKGCTGSKRTRTKLEKVKI